MPRISGATYAVAIVAAAFALVIILRALLVEVIGAELNKPARSSYAGEPVLGFAVFQTCTSGSKLPPSATPWVLIRPQAIWVIGNPPDSPNGCVKIRASNNSTLYVKGSEIEVANKINTADKNPAP